VYAAQYDKIEVLPKIFPTLLQIPYVQKPNFLLHQKEMKRIYRKGVNVMRKKGDKNGADKGKF